MLLRAVEEAAHEANQKLLKDPLECAPENPQILVLEVARVVFAGAEFEPWDVVDIEPVKDAHLGEGLVAIELDKGEDFLVEDLLVLALHEVAWEDLGDELSQKVCYLAIAGLAAVELFEDLTTAGATLCSLCKQVLLAVLPVIRHRTVLAQVVVEIKLLLVDDDLCEHVYERLLHRLPHPAEAEHASHNRVRDLLGRVLSIQDVLLEKGILAVHVRAVEEPVSVDDLIPEVASVVRVVVLLVFDVVFVRGNVLPRRLSLHWEGLCASLTWLLEAKWAVLPLLLLISVGLASRLCCVFLGAALLIKGLLEAAKLVIQVDEDVGA